MEKPFIQWNTQSTLSKKPYQHHVCMFHEQHLASQPEQIHKIQQDSALYLRFKQYSSLYHDYLIDYAMKIDEILPHGCLELFFNHFHIEKDKSFIPLLSSILTNLYPVSSFILFFLYSRSIYHQHQQQQQQQQQQLQHQFNLIQIILLKLVLQIFNVLILHKNK